MARSRGYHRCVLRVAYAIATALAISACGPKCDPNPTGRGKNPQFNLGMCCKTSLDCFSGIACPYGACCIDGRDSGRHCQADSDCCAGLRCPLLGQGFQVVTCVKIDGGSVWDR